MSECNDCVRAQVMIGRDVESNSTLNPVSGRGGRCHLPIVECLGGDKT